MHVLIIGGTGLISTAITRQLLAQGVEVTLFNRGKQPARFPDGAARITGDRRDYPAFIARMRNRPAFDAVIDMITFTPDDAASLIEAFRGHAGQVIFCSTVDVYNRPSTHYPYREDEPYGAASQYGRDKAACEILLMEAHGRGDFPVTILRPASTYGEGGVLIHSFGWATTYLDRLRKGKPIVVHGDGESLWCSCHVDDVARGFVNALGNAKARGKAYHLTGEEWFRWNRYHEIVAEAMGAPAPALVHIPTDLLTRIAADRAGICASNFAYSNIFDNSAARADLGFRYTIPFLEGAQRTIAWLEEHGRIENSDDDPYDDRIIAAWERMTKEMVAAVTA